MKYVSFERMNPLIIAVSFFVMMIGCGPTKRTITAKPITFLGFNSNPFTIQPVAPDTLPRQKSPDTAHIRRILIAPVQHLLDQRNPPYDTLLKYNFQWQHNYLRLVDSNIKRRVGLYVAVKGKDSALIVAKETQRIVKRIQDKQGTNQIVGEGVIGLSETVAGWLIPYIAAIITIHFILSMFKRKNA